MYTNGSNLSYCRSPNKLNSCGCRERKAMRGSGYHNACLPFLAMWLVPTSQLNQLCRNINLEDRKVHTSLHPLRPLTKTNGRVAYQLRQLWAHECSGIDHITQTWRQRFRITASPFGNSDSVLYHDILDTPLSLVPGE
jgi:hypothetical protein